MKRKVTLTQAPDAPATLTALNFTYEAMRMGAISFPVPTINDALASMVDEQPFKLEIDGRTVLEMKWNDGLRARNEMRKCVSSQHHLPTP